MSARELLDAYAAGDPADGDYGPGFQREQAAPEAIAALRQVLALHPRDDDDNCAVCWDAEGDMLLAYPCDTVFAIREALKP